jgi:hypothetical protein
MQLYMLFGADCISYCILNLVVTSKGAHFNYIFYIIIIMEGKIKLKNN